MKRLLFLLAMMLPVLCAGQNPRQAYIGRYSSLAVSEMERTGVPASITLAQALLESGAGQSPLATKAHNHFGLKCHGDWTGERFLYDDETPDECFRVYASAEESYRAHSDYLRGNPRYQSLFDLEPTDYKAWARGLRRAGYATDPAYATKLINLIEDFQLYRFDGPAVPEEALADSMREPEVPAQAETPLPERPDSMREPDPGGIESMRDPGVKAVPESAWDAAEEPAGAPVMEEIPSHIAYRESVSLSFSRPVLKNNGVPYIRSLEGESWESIAESQGLLLRQLLRYNDLTAPIDLKPGTMVYLARKKPQAELGYGYFEVPGEGMTMWEISQIFGVQLKKLRLYNSFRGDAPLEVGDAIILRKL